MKKFLVFVGVLLAVTLNPKIARAVGSFMSGNSEDIGKFLKHQSSDKDAYGYTSPGNASPGNATPGVYYDTISCAYAASIATADLDTTTRYVVIGYITEMGTSQNNKQCFWMADKEGTDKTLYVYYGVKTGSETLSVGMQVQVVGYMYLYKKEPQLHDGKISVVNATDTVVVYDTITVTIPGTLGQALLQKYAQWTDAKNLAIIGSLNETDMSYFSRLTNLKNLDLFQTDITEIGGLNGLSSLEMVLLPTSVTSVKASAFYQCSNLKSISLPNVTKVGESAFSGCTALTSISLPQASDIGNSTESWEGIYTFADCSSLQTVDIPEVTKLGRSVFSGCKALQQINMPKVQSIGESCFENCYALKEIDLSNVTQLGGECFYKCSKLSKVTFSNDLKEIPDRCFQNCSSLVSITLPEGLVSIGWSAFENCPLTTVTLPASLQTLDYAFYIREYNYDTQKYETILTDVYAYMIAPITTSAFGSSVSNVRLHVPALSVSAYRLHDSWYQFKEVLPMEQQLTSIAVSSDFSLLSQDGLSKNVDVSMNANAHLTIGTTKALTIGNFSQTISPSISSSYVNGNYISYMDNYSTLLNYDEVTANSIAQTYKFSTNRWYFISFPFDVNVSDIEVPEETLWVIRKYSGADRAALTGNTWQDVKAGSMMNAGEGYIFQCTNPNMSDVSVTFRAVDNQKKNNLFAAADVTIPLSMYESEFAHNRGWNLVGNPYPSYYRSQQINHDGVITVWNGDGYTAYSLVDDDYYLRPNEAFFVQCAAAGDQMVFAKEGRTHVLVTNSSSAPARALAAGLTERDVYNLTLTNQTYSDKARFVINEQASLNYELSCDASKFMSSNSAVPQLYTIQNDQRLAINERPCGNATIQVGMYCGNAGEYTLSLSFDQEKDLHPILTDKLTNTRTDLSAESYTFTAAQGTCDNRFSISLRKLSTDLVAMGEEEITEGDVFTMGGNKVMHITSRDQMEALMPGCYLLRWGETCEKVVVK